MRRIRSRAARDPRRRRRSASPAARGAARGSASWPTTSSITMRPSSSRPVAVPSTPAAQTPAAKAAAPDEREGGRRPRPRGRSESNTKIAAAKAAPAVPGAPGARPTPAALATQKASRAAGGRERRWWTLCDGSGPGAGPEERGAAPRPGGGPATSDGAQAYRRSVRRRRSAQAVGENAGNRSRIEVPWRQGSGAAAPMRTAGWRPRRPSPSHEERGDDEAARIRRMEGAVRADALRDHRAPGRARPRGEGALLLRRERARGAAAASRAPGGASRPTCGATAPSRSRRRRPGCASRASTLRVPNVQLGGLAQRLAERGVRTLRFETSARERGSRRAGRAAGRRSRRTRPDGLAAALYASAPAGIVVNAAPPAPRRARRGSAPAPAALESPVAAAPARGSRRAGHADALRHAPCATCARGPRREATTAERPAAAPPPRRDDPAEAGRRRLVARGRPSSGSSERPPPSDWPQPADGCPRRSSAMPRRATSTPGDGDPRRLPAPRSSSRPTRATRRRAPPRRTPTPRRSRPSAHPAASRRG